MTGKTRKTESQIRTILSAVEAGMDALVPNDLFASYRTAKPTVINPTSFNTAVVTIDGEGYMVIVATLGTVEELVSTVQDHKNNMQAAFSDLRQERNVAESVADSLAAVKQVLDGKMP